MDYTMKRPCPECPFRKEGGVRLTRGRIEEIGGGMLHDNSFTFPCHKTVDYDAEGEGRRSSNDERHCAGALIFAEKNGTSTQMMRITERLGMYDHTALEGHDDVWEDLDEWLEDGSLR